MGESTKHHIYLDIFAGTASVLDLSASIRCPSWASFQLGKFRPIRTKRIESSALVQNPSDAVLPARIGTGGYHACRSIAAILSLPASTVIRLPAHPAEAIAHWCA